jgi:hypothetical protein
MYPSGDDRPLAETPIHRRNLVTLIDVLDRRFADDPQVYVSGNMFVYYVKGDKWSTSYQTCFLFAACPRTSRETIILFGKKDALRTW